MFRWCLRTLNYINKCIYNAQVRSLLLSLFYRREIWGSERWNRSCIHTAGMAKKFLTTGTSPQYKHLISFAWITQFVRWMGVAEHWERWTMKLQGSWIHSTCYALLDSTCRAGRFIILERTKLSTIHRRARRSTMMNYTTPTESTWE